jgi:hypothetical protein
MKTPNKGEMLGRIFDHMDNLSLSAKMRQLFIDNQMTIADLSELKGKNIAAFEKWYKLHKRSNRLMAFSTHTVLN